MKQRSGAGSAAEIMVTMDALVALVAHPIHGLVTRSILDSLEHKVEVEEDELDEGVEQIHWLSYSANGFLIRHNPRGRIEVVHIFLVAEEGYSPFTGGLSKGLRPSDGRPEVRQRYGSPSGTGERSNDKALGPEGAWDRYDSGEVSIHFLYHYDGSGIRRVTMMASDIAP